MPALAGVDLLVEPGEHVSVVGPSGCGKSTLLAVLLGFLTPGAGRVTVGGVPLDQIDPAAWRAGTTWVPQRPYLFRGTVAENLRMAQPSASDEALRAAVELSGLDAFVAQLPRGLHTALGEGGLTLSAGERQRLALARAALRDAPLVLLDEPVAHLDAHTESQLAARLAPWFAGRTVLVAAHRPQLLAGGHRVVALDPPPDRPGPAPVPVRAVPGIGPDASGTSGVAEPAPKLGSRR